MSKQPLTNVDAAWLGMEDPTNLMMVSGILTFTKPINFEHLQAIIEHRLLGKFERFRMKVVQPGGLQAPYWETDTNFDQRYHLRRIALPAPGDQATLQKVVSDLMSTPLDYSKPLWQFHVIENFGEGCAVMGRLHHCIADGMALMFVLLSLADMNPDAPWPTAEPKKRKRNPGVLGSLFKRVSSTVSTAQSITSRVIDESWETVTRPSHALELAKQAADAGLAAGKLIFRSPDQKTIFKGKLGVMKVASWSRALSLKEIKRIKSVTGGTVNDVLITAMTGGLRRYMEKRGVPVDDVNFRAAIPVNLRTPEEMGEMGNKFGIVFLKLPVYIEDTLERLVEVSKRMDELKNTPEAAVALGILAGIGMTPAQIQNMLVDMFGAKATAVMTNVPGPVIPLYLAGQEIDGIMFWVPQSGRVSLGVSIISYAGKVWLGVATDEGLIPDPDTIIQGFYDEYEILLDMARVAEAEAPAEPVAQEATPAPAAPAPAKPAAKPKPAKTSAPKAIENPCQALTKQGTPCKSKALDGSPYCRVHQKVESGELKVES